MKKLAIALLIFAASAFAQSTYIPGGSWSSIIANPAYGSKSALTAAAAAAQSALNAASVAH